MRFFSTFLAATLGTLVALGLLFFFGILLVVALATAGDAEPAVPRNAVLTLDLSGTLPEITADDPLAGVFGGEPTLDLARIRTALRLAAEDRRVRAVWVRTDGLGAGWASLEEVRAALDRFRATGKPVFASGSGAGIDEAAYFVLSAADSVYAPPLSPFELNGFRLELQFFKRALDRFNLTPVVVRAGTFKAAVEPFLREDLSPENRLQLGALLDDQTAVFTNAVARSRKTTPARLDTLIARAPVLDAEGARDAGLLDGVLDDHEVESRLKRRLGIAADEDLRTVDARTYARTTPGSAGVETDGGEIAVVYAAGAIVEGESGTSANPLLGGDVVGDETFAAAMDEAREDEDVQAVVLRINSPGGSASASESMRRAVARTAAVKPVVVSMGDYAASGGYWIATAADTLLANPLTLTGSVGVFSLLLDPRGLFADRLGITFDAVETGPYADLGAVAPTPDEQALLQRNVDSTYARFLTLVARSRGLAVARADSLGQGRVWTGRAARRNGLVDGEGDLRAALAVAARRAGLDADRVRLRVLPRPETTLERLTSRMDGALAALRRSPADALGAAWADALRALDGRAQALLPARLTIR